MATSKQSSEDEEFWNRNWVETILRVRLMDPKLTISSIKVQPFPLVQEKSKTKLEIVAVFRKGVSDEDKICEMFAKRITEDVPWINTLKDEWAFEKETGFYTRLLGGMVQYSRVHSRHVEIPFHYFPRCYTARCEPGKELVLLDNLLWLDYHVMPRKLALTRRHCKLVMDALATLHAVSYSMHRYTEIDLMGKYGFLQNRQFCPERRKVYDPIMKSYFNLIIDVTHETPAASKLKLLEPKFFDILEDTSDLGGYIFVVCHGDCLSKNLLFYNGTKKYPVKLKMVDFQNVMCASPTTDLSYFLFTSITPSHRRKYMTELLEYYQDSFERCLTALGMTTHYCTLDGLTDDFYKTLIYGFFLACTIVPEYFLKGSAPTYVNPAELEDKIQELQACVEFKRWATDTVNEVDEYGTLDIWIQTLKL